MILGVKKKLCQTQFLAGSFSGYFYFQTRISTFPVVLIKEIVITFSWIKSYDNFISNLFI